MSILDTFSKYIQLTKLTRTFDRGAYGNITTSVHSILGTLCNLSTDEYDRYNGGKIETGVRKLYVYEPLTGINELGVIVNVSIEEDDTLLVKGSENWTIVSKLPIEQFGVSMYIVRRTK